MFWIFCNRGTFTVSKFSNNKQITTRMSDFHTKYSCISINGHTANTHGVSTHSTNFWFVPHDCFACRRYHYNLLTFSNTLYWNKLVIVFQINSNKAITTGAVIQLHWSFLHHTRSGCKHEVFIFREVLRSNNCCNSFSLFQWQQVHNRSATSMTRSLRNLICFQTINFTEWWEEQHVCVCWRNEEMLYEVTFFQVNSLHSLATTLLLTIRCNRQALYITCLGYRNSNFFFSNKIFNVEFFCLVGDLSKTLRVVLIFDFQQFFFNDLL